MGSMFKVGFVVMVLMGAINSFACSVVVDDNYTKNQLMAHGASFNDLSLASVSGLAVSGYSKGFLNDPGNGSCPEYLQVSGRVSFNHNPSIASSCSYAVTVTVKTYMGEDLPDGPFEQVTFSDAEAACSTSQVRIKVPRKLPVRINKPIIVKPHPSF
jgi:hypothetical protein